MSKPINPDNIIIQNSFYPDGIKEIDIWNYYQDVKKLILVQTVGRELIFVIFPEINKQVILRNIKGQLIYLNYENYDQIIHGRTVTIYSCMKRIDDIGIIDIDTNDWKNAKSATEEIYNLMVNAPFTNNVKIRYTGKDSFHIFFKFNRAMKSDHTKELIIEYLQKNKINENYDIGYKRKPGRVNLDLSPNKYRGGFITLGSLSVIGLRSIEIQSLYSLKRFKQEYAKIKIKK